jgi:hypothetical protein
MVNNIAKGSLPPARQRLVELMQQLSFGQILGLHIRHGQPVFEPRPRIVRDIKLASEPALRAAAGRDDFLLKQQVVELFAFCDRLHDGTIDVLEVKHGLPFRLQHTEPLA